ncbi:hypothetical protein JCM11491_001547 [Sporobolomyces phaffii]
MAYAPFQSSRLASSPSTSVHAPAVPSSSDLPSSPTTASFYHRSPPCVSSSLSRNTSRPRLYKSQSSHRHSSARNLSVHSSSSPSTSTATNPFRSVHENARLQRSKQARAPRNLSAGSLVPDEPGGWTRDGEWEEFDQYEKDKLELEMLRERKEYKWEMRLKGEQASDAALDPEDEFDSDQEHGMQEEPPLDILSDYEPPLPSPLDPSATRLPSLASSISSSPFREPLSLAPSPPSDELDDVAMSNSAEESSQERRTKSIRAFESALLEATCPSCAVERGIAGDATGARCQKCGWEIAAEVLGPLELAFAAHGDVERGHLPLFSHTLFTGTLIFCQACEEQFAA